MSSIASPTDVRPPATTSPADVDPRYAARYADLYTEHWWWRAREPLVLAEIRRMPLDHGSLSILDVGCGNGLFFDELSRFGTVWGVEVDRDIVDPRGPHYDRIFIGPFDSGYRPRTSFDLILMLDVLEHMDDPVGALRHGRRLLARGGRILITVPAFNALWTKHDELNRHRTRYNRRSFRDVARRAGLHVEHERYFFHWIAPAKLVLKALERFRDPDPAPPRVPGPFVNAALAALSRAEQRLIGPLGLPFGSSLLVRAGDATEAGRASPPDHARRDAGTSRSSPDPAPRSSRAPSRP